MAIVASGVLPLIPINRDLDTPLHRQVYAGFRDAILSGGLTPGQQVPSSRALATALGISRFPILDAYSQLSAEGYFESHVGAGTFVASSFGNHRKQAVRSVEKSAGMRTVSRRNAIEQISGGVSPEALRHVGLHFRRRAFRETGLPDRA